MIANTCCAMGDAAQWWASGLENRGSGDELLRVRFLHFPPVLLESSLSGVKQIKWTDLGT